jgi:WD40 repeat protein
MFLGQAIYVLGPLQLGFAGGRPLEISRSAPRALAISPDNHWLVTGGEDGMARLWDLRANDPTASPVVLRGHKDVVYALAISPDNHWLATGSWDGTARLWDLRANDPTASPVAISPDNRWLVTGSKDGTTRLWLLQVNDLIDLARITVGRNFTTEEWMLYFPGEPYRKTFPDLP